MLRLGSGLSHPKYWWKLDDTIDSITGALAGTFTYAGTNRTRVNPSSGLIETIGADTARFEDVGGYEALLVEPAGTNLIHYSHELGNAVSAGWWHDVELTSVTANGMLAPDGNTVADGLIGTIVDTKHYVYSDLIADVTQNDKVALTIFAKPGDKDWVYMEVVFFDVGGGALGSSGAYYFNISSGTVGAKFEGGDATVHDYIIEEVANGFYRIGIIVSNNHVDTAKVRAYIFSALANNDNTFPGDTTTVNTWLWGADLKEQAYFDSYVATSAGTATRITESGYPLWTLPTNLFDAEGTMIVWVRFGYDYSDLDSGAANCGILSTADSVITLLFTSTPDVSYFLQSFDGADSTNFATTFSANTWYKLIVKWGYGGKFRIGMDTGSGISWGTEQNFDGSYDLGTNLRIGYGLFGPMHIRQLMLFRKALTDTMVNHWTGSP